ncbi:MAG TPA: putative Ig domain-containing protein [Verrucomicrobiae bacterium]|nr:putative Ig domain-containing protein [Verrucomicrobiae bacterium]
MVSYRTFRRTLTVAAGFFVFIAAACANDEYLSPALQTNQPVILTPAPGPAPRINGPAVYGARPGHPFLYRIPAQGERPIKFSAKGLPRGLRLDSRTGIITGTTPAAGEYTVTLRARNHHGQDSRIFKIVSGETLALTPPMGWNDWYAHYNRISDSKMRQAADIIVSSGMADAGYQYVDIDDCWMNAEGKKDPLQNGPLRDPNGDILPNRHFPDMKALTDYIHSKGLKAGIYSSPGPRTCAGFGGSYQHEAQDARQFANWGFDLLKYDWCSYTGITGKRPTLEQMKQPYELMGGLLKQQDRDILFNLCQYGRGDVWKWGAEVGGQSWRTAGDLGFSLNRIFEVALNNSEHAAWQKPGAWNDPDYIQIGWIGNARGSGLPKECSLTPTEQYSFMSLWCLMSSPLFYSGDLTKLDDFTRNVLCNPDVIAIDQDSLGECARVIFIGADQFLMIKNLANGGHALGLCNGAETAADMTATWSQCALGSSQRVRDAWRELDLGDYADSFTARVPPHGVILLRLSNGAIK